MFSMFMIRLANNIKNAKYIEKYEYSMFLIGIKYINILSAAAVYNNSKNISKVWFESIAFQTCPSVKLNTLSRLLLILLAW